MQTAWSVGIRLLSMCLAPMQAALLVVAWLSSVVCVFAMSRTAVMQVDDLRYGMAIAIRVPVLMALFLAVYCTWGVATIGACQAAHGHLGLTTYSR